MPSSRILWPVASAATLAWLVGVGIILDGVGNWLKVAAVNRVEKRLHKLSDRIQQVLDVEDVEEVK